MATAAKFPGAIAALVDFFAEHPSQPANELILNADINATALSIVATTNVPSSWPQPGKMVIDGEVIKYTSYASATFTIAGTGDRGLETAYGAGAAASHTAGAVIGNYPTAQAIAQVIADLIAIQLFHGKNADIASAGTTDLNAATGGYAVITGTTTITAFGTAYAGKTMVLKFSGVLTLTHNATSLIMRSGANATTAAGDVYGFVSEGGGNWRELFHTTGPVAGTEDHILAVHITDDFMSGPDFGVSVTGQTGGEINWLCSGAGGGAGTGACNHIAGLANHPGIFNMDPGAVATAWRVLESLGSVGTLIPADFFDVTFVVRPNSTNDGNFTYRFGLVDLTAPTSLMAAPNNGIYVEKLTGDTQLFGVCRNASTQTRTAALVTTTAATWINVRIRRKDASTISFSVNGGADVDVTTNIPTTAMILIVHVANNNTSVSKSFDVDLVDLKITTMTR